MPEEVTLVAVEAADCQTVGGAMHPAVAQAVSHVVDLIRQDVARSILAMAADLEVTA